MPSNITPEYKMLEKLLSHKKYEDNGILYEFFNFRHEDNHLSVKVNVNVPEGRGWNQYMLEYFAFNIVNEKVKFVDSSSNMDISIDSIYVDGKLVKDNDYYLPLKLENKLENIFKQLPDFGISYQDFGVLFKVSYHGVYDIENHEYQVVVNCGFNIDKIILQKYGSNKKVVINSVPQYLVESMYPWLMEETDTELEELRYNIESEVYSDVMSEAFSMDKTQENYLALYLIPQKICGKEVKDFTGGEMGDREIEEYFRKLVSKADN